MNLMMSLLMTNESDEDKNYILNGFLILWI